MFQGKPVSAEVAQAAVLVNEGLALVRSNRNEEAVSKLTTALKLAPSLPEAHHNLGIALAKLGRYPEAIEHLRVVLDARPDLASTWLTLGGLYQSTGQIDQSIYCYRQFLTRFPTHAEAPKIASLAKGLEAELKKRLAEEERRNAAEDSGQLAEYIAQIQARIQRAWIRPPSAREGLRCIVNVTQVPGGEVVDVKIGECNGDDVVRQSIEAAVYRASPLPEPSDPTLFERDLRLEFKPGDL